MAWPFIALAAMQAYGQFSANQAQANAEETNRDFYFAQARYAAEAGKRQEEIYKRQSAYEIGVAGSSFASGNIDISSGSALSTMAGLKSNALAELQAIRYKTEMDVYLARTRGELSQQSIDNLRSPVNNFLQIGAIGLQSYANTMGFKGVKGTPPAPVNVSNTVAASQSLSTGYFSGPEYTGMGPGLGPWAGGRRTSVLGSGYNF